MNFRIFHCLLTSPFVALFCTLSNQWSGSHPWGDEKKFPCQWYIDCAMDSCSVPQAEHKQTYCTALHCSSLISLQTSQTKHKNYKSPQKVWPSFGQSSYPRSMFLCGPSQCALWSVVESVFAHTITQYLTHSQALAVALEAEYFSMLFLRDDGPGKTSLDCFFCVLALTFQTKAHYHQRTNERTNERANAIISPSPIGFGVCLSLVWATNYKFLPTPPFPLLLFFKAKTRTHSKTLLILVFSPVQHSRQETTTKTGIQSVDYCPGGNGNPFFLFCSSPSRCTQSHGTISNFFSLAFNSIPD